MFKLELYISGYRIDVFEDENIPINSSIQNVKDISKIFTDYTPEFSVPASGNNNAIFKHWYNVDVEGGFDARVRTPGSLKVNSLPFKAGTFRLNGVVMDGKNPKHYKIQFFGLLSSLSDLFGDDYLSALDLSNYNHTFNFTNVNAGLTTGLVSGDVRYPLISSKKRWYYNTDTSDDTNTDDTVNIAYELATNKGVKWSELKPSLNVMRIIEAIETKYNITFSRDFIGGAAFTNLHLWCSNQEGNINITQIESKIDFTSQTSGSNGYLSLASDTWLGTATSSQFSDNFYWNYDLLITPVSGFESVEYRVYVRDTYLSGSITNSLEEVSGTQTLSGQETTTNSARTFENSFYIETDAPFEFTAQLTIEKRNNRFDSGDQTAGTDVYESTTGTLSSEDLVMSNYVPKMKVSDFVSSIIKMFNLVIDPITDTSFKVMTLDDWYADGDVIDISEYIDYSKDIPVNRIPIPSAVSFKHEKGETFLVNQFNQLFTSTYGNLEVSFSEGANSNFDGESVDIETGFEQFIFERLVDVDTDLKVDVQIGYAVDNKQEEILTEPVLFYALQTPCDSIGLLDDGGNPTEITLCYMPSNGNSLTSPTYTTLWGREQNPWDGSLMDNSLYSNFYEDYITDLFSTKRRRYQFQAVLPSWALLGLKLNNIVIVRGVAYIINEYEMNLRTSEVSLDLLNYIGVINVANRNIYLEQDLGSNDIVTIEITDTKEPIEASEDENHYLEYDI